MKKFYSILAFLICLIGIGQNQNLNGAIIYGALDTSTVINETIVDDNGNIYVTGTFSSFCNFCDSSNDNATYSNGDLDGFVAKYDSNLNLIWTNSFGGVNNDYAYGLDFASDGSILVSGTYTNTAHFDSFILNSSIANQQEMFAAKLSVENGEFDWVKWFPNNGIYGIASNGNYNSYVGINSRSDGNIIIVGNTTSVQPDNFKIKVDTQDMIELILLDNDGNLLNHERIFNSDCSHEINNLTTDNFNNTYIIGYFCGSVDFDPSTNTQIYEGGNVANGIIAKYDSSFNLLWLVNLDNEEQSMMDYGASVSQIDVNKNTQEVYVGVNFNEDTNFNPNGNAVNLIPGNMMFATAPGAYASYNENGLLVEAYSYRDFDSSGAYLKDINYDEANNTLTLTLFIFRNLPDIDFTEETLASPNIQDYLYTIATLIYDMNSNPVLREWLFYGVSGPDLLPTGLQTLFSEIDVNGNIILSGSTRYGFPIYYGEPLGDFGNENTGFIASFQSILLSDNPFEYKNDIRVYPNPARDVVYVLEGKNEMKYSLYDINGRAVLENLPLNGPEIKIKGLSPGLYFLKFSKESHSSINKLIIK